MSLSRRVRSRVQSLATPKVIASVVGVGGGVLVAAAIAAYLGGSLVLGLAITGLVLVAGGFALAFVLLARLIRALDERLRVSDERVRAGSKVASINRLALKSIVSDQRISTRLTKRLSENAERGIRLALATDPAALNGYAGVDRGLIVAILGLAPQRLILTGTAEEVTAYANALAEASPATTVLTLPEAEFRGAFLDQLAAEGRARNAPVPVVVAPSEAALRDVVWGETAELVMERCRVDEFLVLASPEHRSALRGAPPTAAVRATTAGSAAIIVAALRR